MKSSNKIRLYKLLAAAGITAAITGYSVHGQGNKVTIGTTAGAVEVVKVDANWHFTKDFEKYYRVKNPELVEVLDEVVS